MILDTMHGVGPPWPHQPLIRVHGHTDLRMPLQIIQWAEITTISRVSGLDLYWIYWGLTLLVSSVYDNPNVMDC